MLLTAGQRLHNRGKQQMEEDMNIGRKGFPSLVAILMVLGLATTTFAFGENKFEQELEKETGAVKLVREVLAGGYGVITTEELKKLIDSGQDILLVDTMPFADSYKKEHIPGAKQFLFPIPEMTEWDSKETDGKSMEDYAALLGTDKGRTIVIYCGFVKCTRSHNGAVWAKKLGYTNVLRHPGGIFAWKGAGYPTENVK
jgi:thiosulfate/3-mercaptopyruvate sulfurtransferase